jgi:hypothetical protein
MMAYRRWVRQSPLAAAAGDQHAKRSPRQRPGVPQRRDAPASANRALAADSRDLRYPTTPARPAAQARDSHQPLSSAAKTGSTASPAAASARGSRERLGATCDPPRARAVAEDAITRAALVKNHPPDLINVALEMLVKASLELPGFATLDELAARIRHDVNTAMFERVGARIALPDRIALEELLDGRRNTRSSCIGAHT